MPEERGSPFRRQMIDLLMKRRDTSSIAEGVMLNFENVEAVRRWVKENGQAAEAKLRIKLANGSLAGCNRESALTYFSEREVNKLGFKAVEERKLRLRELDAAETSATAAVDSARHAKDAATWARWAVVVAAIALIVSAWPYIVLLLKAAK